MSELTAYEKMLKDGSAFKKIDMTKIQNQQYAQAGAVDPNSGRAPEAPLGEPSEHDSRLEEDHTDWSELDAAMEKRMNALREKANGGTAINKQQLNESQEIYRLKKRVKKLEEAMMLIMETHERLLG